MTKNRRSLIMNAFKNIHSISKQFDLRVQRHHQNTLGYLLSTSKRIEFTDIDLNGMPCSWTKYKQTETSGTVILYCHGGGYTTGNLHYCRILASKFLKVTGLTVFSFDYPLSPENTYPAQLDAALNAWEYLLNCGFSPKNIIVAGESAGGHLALSMTAKLKSRGSTLPAGLILISPWTDLTSSGESYRTVTDDPMITLEYIESIKNYFAPNADFSSPEISPLFNDFTGFPPALIHVGQMEILYSDAYDLYKRMKSHGVDCYFKCYKDMWHIFHSFPIRTADRAFLNISEFIHTLL